MRLDEGLIREIAASGSGRDLDRVGGGFAGPATELAQIGVIRANHALDSSVCGETVVRHAELFQTPGEIGLALALPAKVVLRLEAELIPKLVSLKGVSAWIDGIGPPMLITLQS